MSKFLLAKVCLVTLLAFVLALWFLPKVKSDLPYIHNMDEASHLARVVDMINRNSLDPQYYQKPAFQYFLRVPAVMAGYLADIYRGTIKNFQSVSVKDPFGAGGYAYYAYPKNLLLFNRLLSLFATVLGILAVCFLIFKLLGISALIFSFILFLFNPALFSECCYLAVDPFAFCLSALFLCVFTAAVLRHSFYFLLISALIGGLLLSNKYNHIIFILLPYWFAATRHFTWQQRSLIFLSPVIVFFLFNPFLFLNFGSALKSFTTQLIHYAQPGEELNVTQQLKHLVNITFKDIFPWQLGLFFPAVFLSKNLRQLAIVFIFFILAFLLLHLPFKTTFTRNFIPLLPVLVFLASAGFHEVWKITSKFPPLRLASLFLALICLYEPLKATVKERLAASYLTESRRIADKIIKNLEGTVFVAGELQPKLQTRKLWNVTLFNKKKAGLNIITDQNANYLVVPEKYNWLESSLLNHKFSIISTKPFYFIVTNPPIHFFEANITEILKLKNEDTETKILSNGSCAPKDPTDRRCWLTKPLTRVQLKEKAKKIVLKLRHFMPSVMPVGFICNQRFYMLKVNKISDIPLDVSNCVDFFIYVKILVAPQKFGIPDSRILGVFIDGYALLQ